MKNISDNKEKAFIRIDKLTVIIDEYADERSLKNTKRILDIAGRLMYSEANEAYRVREHSVFHYLHCLNVCKMIIDLEPPLSDREMDIILSAELCHVLMEIVFFPEQGKELQTQYGMDPEVIRIAELLSKKEKGSYKPEDEYFEAIKKNKLSILIKLVEMGIITEQFFKMSAEKVDEYLRKGRIYFFPMCIYGKENYTDIAMVISVIMEKVKLLMDVTDILTKGHVNREISMINEMLILEEENARLRASIKELKGQQR